MADNKDVARRIWEDFRGQGQMDLADELLTPDYVGHDSNQPDDIQGAAGAKEQLSMYRGAFPDMTATVSEQDEDGDEVSSTWTVTGTHDGDLMGVPPTGKKIESKGKTRARCADGKIAEEWHEWSQADMLQQLGVDPSQMQAG
jgi:steroid delta-isomerase-like uncharacterized protein